VQCWADENLLELECKEIGEHFPLCPANVSNARYTSKFGP
jgi:hypothetical protein